MSQHITDCKIWSLERYAYQTKSDPDTVSNVEDWKHYDRTSDKLELTVTPTDQMLIHFGKRQMENLKVSQASSWVKGVTKGDSLMLIVKLQNHTRRFRVKFSDEGGKTGETKCQECVRRLSHCFQIKGHNSDINLSQASGTPPPTTTPVQERDRESVKLSGDATLSQMAQAITEPGCVQLPEFYSNIQGKNVIDVNTYIKLCLTDETFPAFVASVEKELNNIKSEG